jgi:hypothetical protein
MIYLGSLHFMVTFRGLIFSARKNHIRLQTIQSSLARNRFFYSSENKLAFSLLKIVCIFSDVMTENVGFAKIWNKTNNRKVIMNCNSFCKFLWIVNIDYVRSEVDSSGPITIKAPQLYPRWFFKTSFLKYVQHF